MRGILVGTLGLALCAAAPRAAGAKEPVLDPLFYGETKTFPKPTPDQENFQQNFPKYGSNRPSLGAPSPVSGERRPSAVPRPAVAAGAGKPAAGFPAPKQERAAGGQPSAMEGLSRLFKPAKKDEASAGQPRKEAGPSAEDLDAQYDRKAARDSTELLREDGAKPRAQNAESEARAAAADARAQEDVFVAMDLDVAGNPGQYRDAVAQLSKAAGFSVDSRFAPAFKDGRRIAVWGWLPASKIGDAMRLPCVARLEAPRGSRGASASRARSTVKILLRIPSLNGRGALASSLLRLSSEGFRWQRTLGFEPQAARRGTRRLAVIGTAPLSRVNRLMADPSVLRVEPYKDPFPL